MTFKNSSKIKEVVLNTDLSHLVLETDSPYLTPEPFRGMKNEPYNVYYVAKEIASIKGIDIEKVFDETFKNAKNIFNI